MEIIRTPLEMTAWANRVLAAGQTIGLVPTMGFFHEGHLRLMRKAGEKADRTVVSLFVNPIQFGANEDLGRYPRDFSHDRQLAQAEGVDVLFAPEVEDMYPAEATTRVIVSGLTDGLCGESRPGHFNGVTTVVAKLLHIVKPHCAVFGKKDFQQLAVIERMVADLNWDVKIIRHPIVREADGLAMSSRNTYLSAPERKAALCLFRAIGHARRRVRAGLVETAVLQREVEELLRREAVIIEYVSFVDQST
ncbi:MAG: pantoate--beta-alanine ligase, partial [Proteobacteria bacterium]|nr:pantoate--beta-alanine ligase [Pseudomonadota bacterium]